VSDWREQAACRGADTSMFFPERGEDAEAAKAVCSTCPVREECLAEHLFEPLGIWGGHSERERRVLRWGKKRPVPKWHGCHWCGLPLTSNAKTTCNASCRNALYRQRNLEAG
jgi:hypothetical protein